MKEESCLLRLSVFRRKAMQLGFLASLLIIVCAILSCDQAELASDPSSKTALTGQQMQLLPNSTPETGLLETISSFSSMKTRDDQSGVSQLAGSLEDRVIKVGLIVEAGVNISPRYGAELAMFEINQAGGVLGIPIELLRDGGIIKYDISDDIYGPRIDGDDQDGDIYGPPIHRDQGEIMGGILGFPIGLIVKDNEDDPVLSAKLAEELITQDGVVAIIGSDYSRNTLKIAPVAQRLATPMVATAATSPDITKAGDYVFMAAFDDAFQGKVMARFAQESLKAGTAAVLIQAGDPYAEGLGGFFEEGFVALGGDIVAKETYSRGDADFTAQLTAIAAEEPDVVFMPGFVPEVPLAIKQARTIPQENASGITATFLGGDGWEHPDLALMGGAAIEGSYFSTFFSADTADESGRDFIKAYQSMFGTTPDAYAAMGYDALNLVVTAMRRAASVDREAIRDQLSATIGYRGATHIERYDQDRHPIKSAVIMQIKNGQIQFHQHVNP